MRPRRSASAIAATANARQRPAYGGRRVALTGKEAAHVMSNDSEKAMRDNMEFTLDLADKILRSAGTDPLDAFMKAIGTLAQVIHIITPDDQREQTLQSMQAMLRTYLEALDELRGPSSPTIRLPR
jgi:hypothetical protein